MADSPEEREDADSGQPGKLRTWWHPVLANCIRWQLGDHYEVTEEMTVGKKPLQIDVFLVRKRDDELPVSVRTTLAGLAEYLNEFTLVEFKSPSDSLRAGDFQTFLAYAYLYRAQNEPLLASDRLNLLLVAPRLSGPFREELRILGVALREAESGIWTLEDNVGNHRVWAVETEVLAGLGHPLLTMFSPEVLSRPAEVYSLLRANGYNVLVTYVLSQIEQLRKLGQEFAMTHLGAADEMEKVCRELMAAIPLDRRVSSEEERRELLAQMSPAELLAVLSPEAKEALLKQLQNEIRPDAGN